MVTALAGLCICAALPPWGWWPLAIVGFGLWSHLLRSASARRRLWVSVGVGMGWLLPSMLWILSFSPAGYVIAVLTFSAMLGIAGLLVPGGAFGGLGLAATVTLCEWARWHGPFGGVPISMTSLTQARGPLLPLSRIGGPLLITLAVGALGVAAASLWHHICGGAAAPRCSLAFPVATVAVIVALIVGGSLAPRGHNTGSRRVAVVQGGGPQGTLAVDTDPRDPFQAHLDATSSINRPVDMVVWPEDVANIEGDFSEHPWFAELAAQARRIGAPILAGIVEGHGEHRFSNYSVVVKPNGSIGDRYDKVRRVPFGEYVPLRGLLTPFSSLLPRRDQIPGTKPAVVDMAGTRLAVVISWEVFFPRRAREGIAHGGEILVNPTNGSSYTWTMVQTQQLASSRLRAVETGRYVIQAAPTGFSAIVDPDGRILQRTDVGERRVLYATVHTRTGRTLEQLTGDLIPVVAAVVLYLAALAAAGRRRRRNDTADPTPAADVNSVPPTT